MSELSTESSNTCLNIEKPPRNYLLKLREQMEQLDEKDTEKISAIISEKIHFLQTNSVFPRERSKWMSERNNMFTASSDVSSLLGLSKYKSRKKTIKKKLGLEKPFVGNEYTFHGTKFEEVAKGIFELRNGRVVHSVGLVKHHTCECLGATPDGILDNGDLIEIKVPKKRIPTGEIQIGYEIQMQTQMECCDVDKCHFFECIIREYGRSDDYYRDKYNPEEKHNAEAQFVRLPNCRRTKEGLEKGLLGRIGPSKLHQNNEYFYPPPNLTSEGQFQWVKELERKLRIKDPEIFLVVDYWKLVKSVHTICERDRDWWQTNRVFDVLNKSWQEVMTTKNTLSVNFSPEEPGTNPY